jgi:hypothetical protein
VALPCIKCRYYELACTHPAVSEIRANPETGAVKVSPADAMEARSENGLCGPEGALFDSRSLPGLVFVNVLSTSVGRWTAFAGGAVLLDYIFHWF